MSDPKDNEEAHDAVEVETPSIRKAPKVEKVFVVGDDFFVTLGDVADQLLNRGADSLGFDMLGWLVSAKRRTKWRS